MVRLRAAHQALAGCASAPRPASEPAPPRARAGATRLSVSRTRASRRPTSPEARRRAWRGLSSAPWRATRPIAGSTLLNPGPGVRINLFIVQTGWAAAGGGQAPDGELLVMIQGAKLASAERITAVGSLFPDARAAPQGQAARADPPYARPSPTWTSSSAGSRRVADDGSPRRPDPGLFDHPGRPHDGPPPFGQPLPRRSPTAPSRFGRPDERWPREDRPSASPR